MLFADERIRLIAFEAFGPKAQNYCELLDRIWQACLPIKWPTTLDSNYRGMKISSMKDGFIHKLNIMVTSLRSVHPDAEKCINIP